ncbi:redoxin domain-containing protein [Williamsia herbipolensis]|uniref:Alkyl hydroperoxide reductase E n=1 Tax=Williamsia herbipolensis TaxID=1603258 RepID=A0AAU4K4U1_9NOCA|nr:redoxin domain-containing protein [Williamsia herbipolensis]MCX6467715.1 redoxin domain-containing protein [Mycobacteriales bacterium]
MTSPPATPFLDPVSRIVDDAELPVGPLQPGALAPDFELRDQNNQKVSLRAHAGVKKVVVVFFPLAFTGTCEGELGALRDRLPEFDNDRSTVVAVSVGPPPTHKVWSSAQGFLFPILSDFWPHGATARDYGVFNAHAGYANRGTFVVGLDGVIAFSDMVGPGEARDDALWTRVVEALRP